MRCKCGNCCIELIISVVIAAIIGTLFALGLFPDISLVFESAIDLAFIAIIVLTIGLYIAACKICLPLKKCLCCYAPCILAGIIGTIVLSFIVIAIEIQITIAVAIVVSIWALFVSLLLVSLVSYLICIICKLCCCRPCK